MFTTSSHFTVRKATVCMITIMFLQRHVLADRGFSSIMILHGQLDYRCAECQVISATATNKVPIATSC